MLKEQAWRNKLSHPRFSRGDDVDLHGAYIPRERLMYADMEKMLGSGTVGTFRKCLTQGKRLKVRYLVGRISDVFRGSIRSELPKVSAISRWLSDALR